MNLMKELKRLERIGQDIKRLRRVGRHRVVSKPTAQIRCEKDDGVYAKVVKDGRYDWMHFFHKGEKKPFWSCNTVYFKYHFRYL